MKKCLQLLAITVLSCSKDEVNTNLADRIVVTWKTEIMGGYGDYRVQNIWEIIKKDKMFVDLKISQKVWPKLNSDEGSYVTDAHIIYTSWMSGKNTLVFEYNVGATNPAFCGIKGKGAVAGNMLGAAWSTECEGEDPDAEEFTRQ